MRWVASHAVAYDIRVLGDPVLKQVANDVTNIDGRLARTVDEMLASMYAAPGIGLAATQVGINRRFFVYDLGDETGPQTLINPVIKESHGEWVYEEGCLSIPGISLEIVRPKVVYVTGLDLNGNEVEIEADELLARLFQHEIDHLDGRLMLEQLDDEQRKLAMKEWRRRQTDAPESSKRRRLL
jgi:peptide deformylase